MNQGALSSPIGTDRALGRQAEDYALVRQENPAGTEPGSIPGGTWVTRALNTIREDDAGIIVGLASGIMTLHPGRYRVKAICGGYGQEGFGSRLYDTRMAAAITYGNDIYGANTRGGIVLSHIEDVFEIVRATTIAYQCFGTSGDGNSYAQGPSVHARTGSGERECVAMVELWRTLS